MELRLQGRTGLVTGASAGIGRAIAVGLASEGVKLAIATAAAATQGRGWAPRERISERAIMR